MKKIALAIVIFTLLASIISGTMLVNFAYANPMPTDPVISIESPVDKTYDVNSLVLNITIVTKYDGYYFTSTRRGVSYSLDGNTKIAVAEIDYTFDEEEKASTFNGSAVLSELTNGPHSLTIFAEYDYDVKIIQSQKSSNFTIDTKSNSSIDTGANSFPTTLVIGTIVTAAIVGVGLIVYFKKRINEAESA